MRRWIALILAVLMAASMMACRTTVPEPEAEPSEVVEPAEPADLLSELELNADTKPATEFTAGINSAVYDDLDFSDASEYDNATRNLIDAPDVLELKDGEGNVI